MNEIEIAFNDMIQYDYAMDLRFIWMKNIRRSKLNECDYKIGGNEGEKWREKKTEANKHWPDTQMENSDKENTYYRYLSTAVFGGIFFFN